MELNYTYGDLQRLTTSNPWCGALRIPKPRPTPPTQSSPKPKYRLVATGEADTFNGRTYVAIPSHQKITPRLKQQLNLW